MPRFIFQARIISLGAVVFLSLGCIIFPGLLLPLDTSSSDLKILAQRRGCSEFSRSVELTVDSQNIESNVQWFFTDGTSQVGQTVVHTFEEAGPQLVTAIAAGQMVTKRISIPVRGEAAPGPDPFGDDCIENESEFHVPEGTEVDYRNDPPASGPHYSGAGISPIAPGFYPDPVSPEVWVHNLEHGDIVILFDCPSECPESLITDLRGFFSMVQHQVVITRYPGLSSPIMAVAWDVQRRFDGFDAEALRAFHDRRVGQAPEGDN